jgi:hypothetical protein
MDLRAQLLGVQGQESFTTRDSKRGEVVRDDLPQDRSPDLVVVMPQQIAEAANLSPRLIGHKNFDRRAKLLGGLAYAAEAAFDRIKASTRSLSISRCIRGRSDGSSTRSTETPRIVASLSLIVSRRSRWAKPRGPGVSSMARSTSDRFEASPRAVEPNKDSRIMPSSLSSGSWSRRVAMTAPRSMGSTCKQRLRSASLRASRRRRVRGSPTRRSRRPPSGSGWRTRTGRRASRCGSPSPCPAGT